MRSYASFLVILLIAVLFLGPGCNPQAEKQLQESQAKVSDLEKKTADQEKEISNFKSQVAKLEEENKQLSEKIEDLGGQLEKKESDEKVDAALKEHEAAQPSAQETETKDIKGTWVTNKVLSMRATKVEIVYGWDKLGSLQRIDKEAEKKLEYIKGAINEGKYKVVIVHMAMRNETDKKQNLGWCIGGGGGEESSRGVMGTRVYLRGEEGTEVSSSNDLPTFLTVDPGPVGGITYYLTGSMPMDAKVEPKGVIEGRVAFVTKSWYKPAKLFTRDWYSKRLDGHGVDDGKFPGCPELTVSLQ